MGFLGDWFRRRRDPRRELERRGRAALARLFRERRELLRGTSLRPEHGARVQLLDVREPPLELLFGIVRHPRPYQFSEQAHEVLEEWRFVVETGELERLRGHNLSRSRGEDGDAPIRH